jgi:hypothetical protein
MKPIRLATIALALTLAPIAVAHAQGGINLAWNNCITQANAAENIQYACDGSAHGTPFKLVASFVTPNMFVTPTGLPAVVGIEMEIDIGIPASSDPLPDWWRYTLSSVADPPSPPQCRDGNLVYPGDDTGVGTGATGACPNPWANAITNGFFAYDLNFGGNPARARIRTYFARSTPIALAVSQQYLGGVISMDTFRDVDTGSGTCAGCCQPMLLTLSRVKIFQVAGSQYGDIFFLTDPAPRNYVWWNQQTCGAVPTRSTTWGAIKATYR